MELEPAHEEGSTVVYKKEQIVPFVESLRREGFKVAELDFSEGDSPLDWFADLQTKELYSKKLKSQLHLKTVYDGYVCTSIGMIIELPGKL